MSSAFVYERANPNRLIDQLTQTFALCRSIVRPTNWTIAAFMTAHRVRAVALAVATAVVFQTLVHV